MQKACQPICSPKPFWMFLIKILTDAPRMCGPRKWTSTSDSSRLQTKSTQIPPKVLKKRCFFCQFCFIQPKNSSRAPGFSEMVAKVFLKTSLAFERACQGAKTQTVHRALQGHVFPKRVDIQFKTGIGPCFNEHSLAHGVERPQHFQVITTWISQRNSSLTFVLRALQICA